MSAVLLRVSLVGTAVLALGCVPRQEEPPPVAPELSTQAPMPVAPSDVDVRRGAALAAPDEVGLASWYGNAFKGKRTSSGERFDPALFTAAHKKLPFGTWVDVTRSDTGRTVRVRINDRGPNGRAAHRIIDLSQRAAQDLDLVRAGVARVELRIVRDPAASANVNR